MTHLTLQFKQDYKKDPEIEDIIHWTTGIDEVLDSKKNEVDHVPVDVNLVAAVEALDFALVERYAVFKPNPTSEEHADCRQAVNKNWWPSPTWLLRLHC